MQRALVRETELKSHTVIFASVGRQGLELLWTWLKKSKVLGVIMITHYLKALLGR